MLWSARVSDVTVGTPTEPISYAEAAAQCRIVSTADQTYVTGLTTIVRQAAEDFTGCDFVPKSRILYADTWPGVSPRREDWWDGVRQGDMSLITASPGVYAREFRIPHPPLLAVSAITVYDDTDTGVVFDPTNYYVDATDRKRRGRVVLRRGSVWPPALRVGNAIKVEFTCGYGGSGPVIPAQLKQGMLMTLQYIYRNRGDMMEASQAIIDSGAAALLSGYQDFDK